MRTLILADEKRAQNNTLYYMYTCGQQLMGPFIELIIQVVPTTVKKHFTHL